MNKKKLLSIILNQYLIAFIITLFIIYFTPNYFSKYLIELKESRILGKKGSRVYYEDLNNDSISEKIICYENSAGNAAYEIQGSKGGLIDQWNFSKKLNSGMASLFFFDANDNGFKEIYLVTQKQDSIFLNISEPFLKSGIHKQGIFIDIIGEHNNEYISNGISFKLGNKKNKGVKEVFFNVCSGFSGTPRNVYKYNYNTNEIVKSPHLTNTLTINYITDINDDEFEELIFHGYANGNKIDSVYTTRSDYSSWLTVLDNDLNFLFEPVEIQVPFSATSTVPYKFGDEYKLLSLIDSRGNNENLDKLCVYSLKGELEKAISIPSGFYNIFLSNKQNEIILYNRSNGNAVIFDKQLWEVKNLNILSNASLYKIDIDRDEELEWLAISENRKSTTLYREGFTNPVSFEIPVSGVELVYHGSLHNENINNGIYFQKGDEYFIYNYFKNPLYYFKYLVYLGIYLAIFGLVWLIAKGQNIRNERKEAIEKEIAQLQIKTIKNQVDPHFVFNAINTISEMTLTGDKLAADDFICKFSELMRKTLKGSDKISHTLKEELDYVENFIQLQQIRFNNNFSYQLKIGKNVDVQSKVPKHVLYCYVENAIKHGLSKINKGGLLKIEAIESVNKLKLTIENNGGGLEDTKTIKKHSTGNGILIMEKIYDLYFKLYHKKITYKLIEVKNKLGKKSGVRIDILISK